MEERIYKSLLIKESNNTYMGFEPTKNLDPDLPDIGAGMYEIAWNKPLPEDIDSLQYKYENGELEAV